MDKTPDDYHISFFKPTTPQATANRNMVVVLVLIWFFAIFGFQFLLWIFEKPTPEPAYQTFTEVWPKVSDGTSSNTELQEFGQSTLSVLGKIMLSEEEKSILSNALSWTLLELAAEEEKAALIAKIQAFEKVKSEISSLSDQTYIEMKSELSTKLSPMLSLSMLDVRSKILPIELSSAGIETLTAETKEKLPSIMSKYLIHNQSFLTDFKFLGFPFHYFYTATFLLILFVGLCWLYCVRTDQLNAKMNVID